MTNRIIQVLLTLSILAGCSSIQTPVPPVEWQAHQARLQQIHTYQITGKLGYISPKERRSLNFQWKKSDSYSQLRLTTFLGQTVLKMDIHPQQADAETYEGKHYSAPTPELLLHQLTGLDIPLSSLSQWILGRPALADDFSLKPDNTLDNLEKKLANQQWQVQYKAYTAITFGDNQLPLPDRLLLQQGHTKINIHISQWKVMQ
ncbi:lipoprotein insertase outer membrane protein LolB [Vibrio mangrovi]|uniref:Outer-membrane lipoprotein LolB n=1 Tax=Vibrio mangrovi TaxID=474394 RepID=A0A1Y6IVA2_9VIBR|nr:lipoprotein insertase outer membrane protein LolB [Vibrio mangrovi]MDW6001554.1 lipoprotein insertase outer membrane protein LolB [Vibrio mangrovi]SMS00422.1 Outer-membrane lipoprotein LolB precursor [Vibrio mangrovi]